MRVAVDAMGGDHAPQEIVLGSLQALERNPEMRVALVGDEEKVRPVLEREGGAGLGRVSALHASEVIEMGESPVEALRRKTDTSIQRCIESLREREVDAVVSAGDTGGVVACATKFAPRLKGVKRAGIAIPVPTTSGRALVIDVGANIRPKPLHLLQYAYMATSYAQGIENPRVGVLSVGEEAAKGTDLVKRTRELLSESGLAFVGNVEGRAIFQGVADVVVCDGFVGNVILKVAEGMAEAFLHTLLSMVDFEAGPADGMREFFTKLKARLDYSATGGAPLLGFEGSVIICHGRSKATAIANAVQVAHDFTRSGVNDRILAAIAGTKAAASANRS